jgi:hypothetical protein
MLSSLAMVHPTLQYEGEGYFPTRIRLKVGRVDTITKTDAGFSHGYGTGKLAVGMIGNLPLSLHLPHLGVADKFRVVISEVSEDGETAIADVERPSNVPICSGRWSIEQDLTRQQKARDSALNSPPWPYFMTLVGLEIPHDFQLDDNTHIIKFTDADAMEIGLHLSSRIGMPLIFNPVTHAVCFRGPLPNLQDTYGKLLMALRLFKSGYLERGLDFHFEGGQSGHSLQDKPPYRHPYQPLNLLPNDIVSLQIWWDLYNSVLIEEGSTMHRALRRFERVYSGELHERLTDTVISLETLLMPGGEGELRYRVAQRASFLVSADPATRLQIAQKIKKAYDMRSSLVHANARERGLTEEFAEECRDLLRLCLKTILESDSDLRREFCRPKKSADAMHNFFDALVNFGDLNAAVRYWRTSRGTSKKSGP